MNEKTIKWPFWIQIAVILYIPIIIATLFIGNPIITHWIIGLIFFPPALLYPAAGILGLVMSGKMKKLRVATLVLAIINLIKFVLLIISLLFFVCLYMLGSATLK